MRTIAKRKHHLYDVMIELRRIPTLGGAARYQVVSCNGRVLCSYSSALLATEKFLDLVDGPRDGDPDGPEVESCIQ